MIKVFTTEHAAEAHLVRGLLQGEGIAVEVRGETIFLVWVLLDFQVPLAMEALARYSREGGTPDHGGLWLCPACGDD